MKKQVIITRLLYEDDNRFQKRLSLYKQYLLSSLEKQTNKDFDVAALCNRKHAPVLRSIGVIPYFTREGNFGTRDKTWHIKIPWSEIEGLDKYDIQSNIDSDDWVSGDYIQTIQELAQGDKSIHIHFQPLLVDIKTGLVKKMKSVYNENNGSAFCSLYQPNKDNYIYIGQDGHRRMQNYADKTIIIDEGRCFVGVHDDNDSTHINS